MTFKVPEQFRLLASADALMGSTPEWGNNGAFMIPIGGKVWRVIASDQAGWEHVSISRPSETPSWPVMCFIKALFWSEEDCVLQYHPAASEYVNCHPHCLHLWRPIGVAFPIPPSLLVGPR